MLVGVPKGCQNKGSLWQHHKFAIIQRMTSKTSRNLLSDLPPPSPSRPKYFSSCLTPSLAFPSPPVTSISWSMLLGLPCKGHGHDTQLRQDCLGWQCPLSCLGPEPAQYHHGNPALPTNWEPAQPQPGLDASMQYAPLAHSRCDKRG